MSFLIHLRFSDTQSFVLALGPFLRRISKTQGPKLVNMLNSQPPGVNFPCFNIFPPKITNTAIPLREKYFMISSCTFGGREFHASLSAFNLRATSTLVRSVFINKSGTQALFGGLDYRRLYMYMVLLQQSLVDDIALAV